MANLTLPRRDSYLEFMRGEVKPDTLTALHTAPVHLHSLFPDSLLVKAEDDIRHQPDWSKVSLYPSTSFLSKNQLAKEGPDSVAPVVIPALAPTLDKSLKGDKFLCPVRALWYYLDRTSDLRQNKELVFVSFKKGFDKDISPATMSSWIQQTVILCYELSDQEDPYTASGQSP